MPIAVRVLLTYLGAIDDAAGASGANRFAVDAIAIDGAHDAGGYHQDVAAIDYADWARAALGKRRDGVCDGSVARRCC